MALRTFLIKFLRAITALTSVNGEKGKRVCFAFLLRRDSTEFQLLQSFGNDVNGFL